MAEESSSTNTKFETRFPEVRNAREKVSVANFGVCVVQNLANRKEYLAVDESRNRGWWLPAGYIDPGEPVIEGTRRECVEEAGVEVTMLGVLRIEYSGSRCRFVYVVEPKDAKQTPKTVPDKESNGAKWMTVEQLYKLGRTGRKLRGPELLAFGTKLNDGYCFPGPEFLVTTYEDKNPTWSRNGSGCNTNLLIKVLLTHNRHLYCKQGSNRLPCVAVPKPSTNGDPQKWLSLLFPELHTVMDMASQRVVRVYHTMRDDGGSMGFVFTVKLREAPEGFEAVDPSPNNFAECDQEDVRFACKPGSCWNMSIFDAEWAEIRMLQKGDTLFEY